jgi:myo-inositol-1-phosphate synthase
LKDELSNIHPLPAAFNHSFIAANQKDRVDNIIGGSNSDQIAKLREHIKEMKTKVDKVVVLWTANTEMYSEQIDTIEGLEKKIKDNSELPSSVLYAYASIMEHVIFLNGSPQNTLHPAIVQLAEREKTFLSGNDFKTGQTRFKTMMGDFLISNGLRLASVVSYNHLGNNDGKNLSEDKCFRSKEISKSSCLDDMIFANKMMYPDPHSHPIDHTVVIKYIPFVGDSKRALDEYNSQIFLGGVNTIESYNICEDSLLAAPIMIDIVLTAELLTRISVDGKSLGPILSYLSFFFKAPITNKKGYVINNLTRQRQMLVNFMKACAGYGTEDETLMSFNY